MPISDPQPTQNLSGSYSRPKGCGPGGSAAPPVVLMRRRFRTRGEKSRSVSGRVGVVVSSSVNHRYESDPAHGGEDQPVVGALHDS